MAGNQKSQISDKAHDLWRLLPHTFAAVASHGRWKPYPFLQYLSNRVVDALCKGRGRILVSIPPQHGKSEFISHWLPAWYFNTFPDRRVLLGSYESDFAASWGRKVRDELQRNSLSWTKVSRNSSSSSRWECIDLAGEPTGGGMVTAGVGGPITGKGAGLLILDDPHKSWAEAQSPTYQQRAREFFDGTFYTRRDSEDATIIVVSTRWSPDDLVGYLLNKQGDQWENIRLPAIAEEGDLMGRKVGEALCPERFSAKSLVCEHEKQCNCQTTKIAVGSRVWASVYQQRPTAERGGIVEREWWQYWKSLPSRFDRIILSWDAAFKKTKTSSYVVGQVWGTKKADRYLLDQVRDRMTFTGTLKAIEALSAKWPKYRKCLVEDKANGSAILDTLKREVRSLKPVNPEGSKEARASAISPQIEAGNVYLPHPSIAPWVNDYVEEWAGFPYGASDQVDSTSQALDELTGKKKFGNIIFS